MVGTAADCVELIVREGIETALAAYPLTDPARYRSVASAA